MTARPLLLRWALVHVLAGLVIGALGVTYVGEVSGAPAAVAVITLVFAFLMSLYAGLLAWRADGASDVVRDVVQRDLRHVRFAVDVCQLLGLVGAATGFYLISRLGATGSAGGAVEAIVTGLGAGLIATITGVLCSLVLAVEHHLLLHAVED